MASELNKLNFLIVDDEEFMLKMIARILKSLGVEHIETAINGLAALELLKQNNLNFDIVLCDLNMPGMDGIEFLRHVSDLEFQGGVGLISGEDRRVLETVENLAQAHNLNILGALSKPITPAALSGILDKFSKNKRRGEHSPSELVSEEELRRGIRENELTPYFQPKVSVATKELISVEALVRWPRPEGRMVFPDAFIPAAEKFGLIDDLTDLVFRKSMEQGGKWLAEGLRIKVAVNISIISLDRLDLPEFIVDTAAEYGMGPSNVMLEVTESRLMEDIKKPLEILTRLRMKGIGLSIDDFGTGHSSMEQLKRIPFTELKVDRAFVNGAAHDGAARAILESSVSLAKNMNMTIVAEGAENQEDWDLVAGLGVDLVQGYFVAKPMPGEEIVPWLKEWQSKI